jgi:hypothetical protein
LDQIIQSNTGKNNITKNSVTNEDFDPNPYLKNNINKLDEQLFENDEDDHKRKLTELLFTYLENPFRYDKEEASISFNKDLDLYRLLVRTLDLEDIKALDSAGGAEAQGQSYSVWLYKGGANCYHRWERRVYRKKLTKEGKIYGGGTLNGTDIINVNEAVRQGFKLPKNPKDVAIAPIASDYGGYTADYAREHGIPKSRNIR